MSGTMSSTMSGAPDPGGCTGSGLLNPAAHRLTTPTPGKHATATATIGCSLLDCGDMLKYQSNC